MYETKSGKKFGSIYAGKRFDSYHGGPGGGEQPGEMNDNEHSTPKHHGEEKAEKVNTMKAGDSSGVEAPEATVQAHGAAHTTHISHSEDGKHTVSSEHPDGHVTESEHESADLAHNHAEQLSLEAGGEHQADSPKKRYHPDQQLAESENRNYEVPDLI